jgi:hypothetical protein
MGDGPKVSDLQKRLTRIEKLVLVYEDLTAKQHDVVREMRKLLAGERGIGDLMKEAIEAYKVCWEERYESGFHWSGAENSAQMKTLLKTFTVDELIARMVRYLRDDDKWLVERRHPFRNFAQRVNQYAPMAVPSSRAIGCHHSPPCTSDAQHTERSVQEQRN